MGYHSRKIDKGNLGYFSKIIEEYEELRDAHNQSSPVLELCELADLLGAIRAYTEYNFKITLKDLLKMTDATESAFREGIRK